MPALTEQAYAQRRATVARLYNEQPLVNLVQAGCCPSLTIVDFGLPTEHVVYCEKYSLAGFGHAGPHVGLAGVDTGPDAPHCYWQWPQGNP